MHWIINSLAFVGTLALAAITIFVWACWRDATKQRPGTRQIRPGGTSGRHGPGGNGPGATGRGSATARHGFGSTGGAAFECHLRGASRRCGADGSGLGAARPDHDDDSRSRPSGLAGGCSFSSASRSAPPRPGSGSTGAQTTSRRQPRTSAANRQHTSSAAAAQPGRPTNSHGASPVFSPSTHTTARFGHRIHTLRHQHRQAWDQAMRVKQAQDLAAFYAALAMAEEAGRTHGRDGREAPRS